MKTERITVTMDPQIIAAIDAAAANEYRSRSNYINEALRDHLTALGIEVQETPGLYKPRGPKDLKAHLEAAHADASDEQPAPDDPDEDTDAQLASG
jgi:Arc/MetJ-type ribon-helix-helix transcriptional regulator